mmetsp:Transcript_4517/g.7317  ORF Transcript_4517/g.7317 Transcript_4517/m.7317 type:complete len:100 (+) Transcript_4517:22-321(+)
MSLPGGIKASSGVSADAAAVANSARASIEKKAGKEFTVFEPVQVSTQTVAGTNYFFKILVGENEYIHARVFKDLPHNNSAVSCHSVQLNKSLGDTLSHF